MSFSKKELNQFKRSLNSVKKALVEISNKSWKKGSKTKYTTEAEEDLLVFLLKNKLCISFAVYTLNKTVNSNKYLDLFKQILSESTIESGQDIFQLMIALENIGEKVWPISIKSKSCKDVDKNISYAIKYLADSVQKNKNEDNEDNFFVD